MVAVALSYRPLDKYLGPLVLYCTPPLLAENLSRPIVWWLLLCAGTLTFDLASATRRLVRENTRLREDHRQLSEEKDEVLEANDELSDYGAALREENGGLREEYTGVRKDYHEVLEDNSRLRKKVDEQSEEIALFSEEREAILEDNTRLRRENGQQSEEIAVLREEKKTILADSTRLVRKDEESSEYSAGLLKENTALREKVAQVCSDNARSLEGTAWILDIARLSDGNARRGAESARADEDYADLLKEVSLLRADNARLTQEKATFEDWIQRSARTVHGMVDPSLSRNAWEKYLGLTSQNISEDPLAGNLSTSGLSEVSTLDDQVEAPLLQAAISDNDLNLLAALPCDLVGAI
ncbi:hypothetical protein PsYK624_088230 [Phanerochaete sordida]|uniref:Uncharacterized protein n=1 Tax=Phanerochaete sordida TaxID=48140 RepID=A0A9P3LFH6_9APHY|nr:hypothetical protein PsYK624_088230 [Phanerochaete sordida]